MRLALLFLVVVGCGEPPVEEPIQTIPCEDEYDHYVKGLCIKSNGFDVDPKNIKASLEYLELHFNEMFDDDRYRVDVAELIQNFALVLEYVWIDFLEPVGKTDFKPTETRMYVAGDTCWRRNYVLIHEILHVIAYYRFHVKRVWEHHYVPNLFVIWADTEVEPRESTVEYLAGEDIKGLCGIQD